MQIEIFKNSVNLSEAVAEKMIKTIRQKPNATLCLTSGNTPELAYQIFVNKALEQNIDCTKCTIIGLDEWVGIGPENIGSCQYIVKKLFIEPLKLDKKQYHFFDGLATDLLNECQKIDTIINTNGGLDFIVIGIGLNGHLGLNEPNVDSNKYCHVTDLADITINIGQKYFASETKLTKGITLGLNHILEAKEAVLMAFGENKATIISKTINEEISMKIPSTLLRKHKNASIMIDELASLEIN